MSDVQSDSKLPLYVFGTLRRGHRNHHFLDGRYDRMIPAELRGYQRLHELMIAECPGGVVDGELFHLQRAVYDATLAGCDELEEIPPGSLVGDEYQRKAVTVHTADGPVQAWAYVQPER
ncbi:MAG: gamma-glutamylcyclotransferase [Planctomycetes bacterium]|nr:gamma-glutamylcyclotransferase [Planctomycetota bacterium]